MITRETIYAALFTKLSAAASFVTKSRKLRHWADVAASEQPALFLAQGPETPSQTKGLPAKWSLAANIYLYVNVGEDPEANPSAIMNPIVDAVEGALAPDPATGYQDLGGLVSHCWIAGPIETDEGVLGPQGVRIIPIEIVAA